jgi:carbon monoxide dehydrogenase subunit G
MTKLVETATTSLQQDEAFAHVAEFENIEEWDPGVVSATKLSLGETRVGTIYDLVLSYGGRTLSMQYIVTEYDPHRRITLEGSGGVVAAVDTITFASEGDSTTVAYEADLRLTGLARLFQPFMGGRFAAIGTAAGDGLRRWLAELETR